MTKARKTVVWIVVALLALGGGYGVYVVVERYLHPERYRYQAELAAFRSEVLKHMPWAEEKGSSEKLMGMLGDLAVADWQALDGGWWKKAEELIPRAGVTSDGEVENLWDGDFGEDEDAARRQIREVFKRLASKPELVALLCSDQSFSVSCNSTKPLAYLPSGKPLLIESDDELFCLNSAFSTNFLADIEARKTAIHRVMALWIAGRDGEAETEMLALARHIHRLVPLCLMDLMVLNLQRAGMTEFALAMHDERKLSQSTVRKLYEIWTACPVETRLGAWYEAWASLRSSRFWQASAESIKPSYLQDGDTSFDSEDAYEGEIESIELVQGWLERAGTTSLESCLQRLRTASDRPTKDSIGDRFLSQVTTQPRKPSWHVNPDTELTSSRDLREYCSWFALGLAARATDAERQEFIGQAKGWEPIRFTVTWEPLEDSSRKGKRLTVRAELGPLTGPLANVRFKPETVSLDVLDEK